jgi:FlaG/FlaF family flagellin (archaellin)
MKLTKLAVLLLAIVLPLAAACKSRTDAGDGGANDTNTATAPTDQGSSSSEGAVTQTTEQEIPGTANPNDVNPVSAQSWVDDVTLGHKTTSDGEIAAADQGDDFAPGDPIYVAMKVADAPANSTVKIAWYGPGETKVGDEEKSVAPGTKYLTFSNTKTSSWAKGDYRVEVWVGDEKVNQQEFQIVDKGNAGK